MNTNSRLGRFGLAAALALSLSSPVAAAPEDAGFYYRYRGGPIGALGTVTFGTVGFATAGEPYSISIAANTPVTSYRMIPTIAWLSFSGGNIIGEPPAPGSYTFKVEGLDGSGNAIATSDPVTVTALSPVTVALGQHNGGYVLPEAQLGKAYTFNFSSLATVGGQDPQTGSNASVAGLTWSFGAGSDVPEGLALTPGPSTGGILSGEPTELGTFNFQVVATHSNKEGRQTYTITVGPAVLEVVQISSGFNHTCAVTTEGGVKCWGEGTGGQLGDNSSVNRNFPVDVVGLTTGVTSVSAGNAHTCALTTAGAVKCWGTGGAGQLGNRTNNGSSTPVNVYGLGSGVTAIAAGSGNSACAVHNGVAKCWGDGAYGKLGSNTSSSNEPIPVSGSLGTSVSSVALGTHHACALTSAGAVWCWGYGNQAQLGENDTRNTTFPVQAQGLTSGVTAIDAGHLHTCAIQNGQAMCWGSNGEGQLGNPAVGAERRYPTAVPGLASGVTSIATGTFHTCAVHSGAAKCWGRNNVGQVGDGTQVGKPNPTPVTGLSSGIMSIGAGNQTCAMTSAGRVKCWGEGQSGNLGNNGNVSSSTPVDVAGG